MKLKIITFAVCFALIATPTFAETTYQFPSNTQNQYSRPQMQTLTSPLINQKQPVNLFQSSPQEYRKQFNKQKAQERELMYTMLNLSNEQKAKAEAIDAKTKSEIVPLIRKSQIEGRKLRDLYSINGSNFAISRQKRILKSTQKKINKCLAKSKKSFNAILTKEQLEKFQAFEDAKKDDQKTFIENAKNHKQSLNIKKKNKNNKRNNQTKSKSVF